MHPFIGKSTFIMIFINTNLAIELAKSVSPCIFLAVYLHQGSWTRFVSSRILPVTAFRGALFL